MTYSTRILRCVLSILCFLVFLRVEGRAESARALGNLPAQIGQLFMFGIATPELDTTIVDHLRRTRPGGYILFRRNMLTNQQTARLISELQKLSFQNGSGPAFIALDQEGGGVYRLPLAPLMPSPWAVGQSGRTDLARKLGREVAVALHRLGFNMNLAPVLDLGSDEKQTFLATRTYGTDQESVANLGTAFAEGLLQGKLIPVAKHFPGMGPVINDPHQSVVRRTSSQEQLKLELQPFEKFAKLSPTGMMLSHLVYPHIDVNESPATYSKSIVQDLLLKKLEYKGLIVTDDMMMEGSVATKDFQENVVRAFEAGAHVIMVSWSRKRQRAAVKAIHQALLSGRISADDLMSRLEQIKRIKEKLPPAATPPILSKIRLLGETSKDYREAVNEIFVENLLRQTFRLQLAMERLPSAGDFYLLAGQAKYANLLNEYLPLSEKIRVLPEKNWRRFLQERGRLLVFVRSPQDAALLKAIPEHLLEKTLVINQWKPHFAGKDLTHEVQIFMSHSQIYRRIAEWVSGVESVQSQHAIDQFRVGSAAIRNHPGSQSKDELRGFLIPPVLPSHPPGRVQRRPQQGR